MLVYQADKTEFLADFDHRDIEEVIHQRYQDATSRRVGKSELQSWRESLGYVARVLRDDEIPGDVGVAIEFMLPQSLKRIDVILAGHSDDGSKRFVIIELKQWSSAAASGRDGIVYLREGRPDESRVHPSYQAWSYAAFLEGFNEAVHEGDLQPHPCAYLHNYEADGVIDSEFYKPYVDVPRCS